MTKLCGGLIDYKEIHDSFYGVKSLVVQLDEIVHRYKTACEKTRLPFIYNDSTINQTKIVRSTPIGGHPSKCRLDLPNLSPINKIGDKIELCENPECPYAPPSPCSSPHCPFRKQFQQKSELPDDNLGICPNPECPYNGKDSEIASQLRKYPDCVAQEQVCVEESLNTENTTKNSDQDENYETAYVSENRVEIDTTPCRPATCFKHGGALECENCLEIIKKRRKIRNKQQTMMFTKKPYVWSPKDRYPGYHIGHQQCCTPVFLVPPKQGWLWNISLPCLGLKPRIGWRPGAVSRKIASRIRKHRKLYEMMLNVQQQDDTNEKIVDKKPNLYLVKKQGDYMVTMNCVEDPNRKPLQFKIEKNEREKRSCYCGDDDDDDDGSESSSDGFEFEFKSPTMIKQRESRRKPRKRVTKETQYNPNDFQAITTKSKKGKGKKGKDKKKNKKQKKKKKK